MENALFITFLFTFLQIWAGASIGTAFNRLRAGQFSARLLLGTSAAVLVAVVPFGITAPTWLLLRQPLILVGEVVILALAIAIPMFVPQEYRAAAFGPRTYWIWLGLALVPCGIYLLFYKSSVAAAVGGTVLLVSALALWRGVRILRWTAHNLATPDDPAVSARWGDSK